MRPALAFIAAGLAIGLSAAAARAEAAFGPLLSPEELVQARAEADPLILDIRTGETGEGEPVYAAGHIPGAVHAPYGRFRGPADNPGRPPSDESLTELFRSLGVTQDRPVVVVHEGRDATDFGAAARVYWTLKSAGLDQLAILNGGMNAWTSSEARPISTEPVEVAPSDITVTLSDRWLATQSDVQAIVEGEQSARLLDARPAEFFEGETAHPAAARPGTLPQSDYFTHSGWFASGPAIVHAEAAKRLADAQGLTEGAPVVSFCNTGHWAATNWFALSELAGIQDVKLYAESMVGWSNAGLDMANTPSVVEVFWSRVRNAF